MLLNDLSAAEHASLSDEQEFSARCRGYYRLVYHEYARKINRKKAQSVSHYSDRVTP